MDRTADSMLRWILLLLDLITFTFQDLKSGRTDDALHQVFFMDVKSRWDNGTTLAAEEMHKQPFVIGVAGGAASGKTTVCDMIIQQLHDQRVVLVNQDSFYHDLTEEELTRVHEYNFDHPDAFDTEQLLCAMEKFEAWASSRYSKI
ncbi:hypothetical protein OIU84_003320 [Salix udensis]|uniref:Phosphoribulokinase/uridine kinase domain-containing protein n=1 Tax=Salix udensis TaxID=889485 RepID=A0AAD6P6B1_9ROSI|nr:hypothetical protein OIU84_003320 [Salix udensis]